MEYIRKQPSEVRENMDSRAFAHLFILKQIAQS